MNKENLYKKWWIWTGGIIVLLVLTGSFSDSPKISQSEIAEQTADTTNVKTPTIENTITPQIVSNFTAPIQPSQKIFDVVKVVDGDTIDVSINGTVERIRLIGINTPETVDPRKSVECFGVEASNKAKSLLSGKKVILESDISQGERDKYERLLRYVFFEDGTSFNLLMIKEGYAYEYTYDTPYKYQAEYRTAQKEAETNKSGLWGNVCNGETTQPVVTSPMTTTQTGGGSDTCTIKGNIGSGGEKIFHVIGCGSYNKTIIDESKGEKWFCSEQEAISAGWRKALNCN